MKPGGHKFLTLDAMRGIAALAVVVFHCRAIFPDIQVPRGYLAVDFFFMLSGLVLAHAYGKRLSGELTLREFMRIRINRLYPLYLVCTIASALLIFGPALMKEQSANGLFPIAASAGLASLMLPTPLQILPKHFLMPMNVPSWSLVYELLANGVMAIVWRWLNLPNLCIIIAVSALLLAATALTAGSLDVGDAWGTATGGLCRVTYAFFAGVLLGRLPRPKPRQGNMAWLVALMVLPVFLIDFTVAGAWFDLVCSFVWFPLVIWIGAIFEPRHEAIFRLLGLISYPVYVVQSALIVALAIVLKKTGHPEVNNQALVFLLFMAIVCVVSYGLQEWYDTPFRAKVQSKRWRAAVLP